ncbi:MAG TPA: tetratricopeptide repeat protein [Smithellaceae bacterium]|nr:tetratricopeptide repeat protein [Smithellaceae bacterium]
MIVYACLLCFSKYLWIVFASTDVGKKYAEIYIENYRATNDVLNGNIITLAMKQTLISFTISLVAGMALSFLHIIRYVYSNRGFFGRIIMTGLPLTYVVALYTHYSGNFSHMDTAVIVALVPTLCVFTGCFRLAEEYVPGWLDIIPVPVGKKKIRLHGVEIFTPADKSVHKDEKQKYINPQNTLQDIRASFKAYMLIVAVVIAATGVLIIAPKMQKIGANDNASSEGTFKDQFVISQSGVSGRYHQSTGSAKEWYDKAVLSMDQANGTDSLKTLECLNEAIRLKPDYVDAYKRRGRLYAKMEHYQLAIDDYDEVIRMTPNDASAYHWRADAYFSQGSIMMGCSDARKACELGRCEVFNEAKNDGDCL